MSQKRDYYEVLSISNSATAEEVRRAYKQCALKHHPDRNPGNKKAEEQFKEVAGAYDLLSDAEKRGRFDRGEIDASGAERPRHAVH